MLSRKMAVRCCLSRKGAKITLWIASAVLVVSVAVMLVFPTIYNSQLKKQSTLTEGTLITKVWEDFPLPMYEKLYFFNITNGKAFLKGAPLNVTEVGPYTYVGKWVKNHPVWNSNGTVSYREKRTYHFVRDMSVGGEEEVIYTLNGPMIIAANMLKKYNIGLRMLFSFLLKLDSETIVTKKSIGELAYGGYPDIIIKLAPLVQPDIPYKDGRFSWLYGKNDTDDGLFTVFTGADNASMTNMINNWNGAESLPFWKGDTCNMMNGTSVETGPPLPETPETYSFFQTIFCRSLTFNYTGDQTHFGVNTKRFVPTDKVLANGSENPDNWCFDGAQSRASGVLDVQACQFGAPAFISFPHFHLADPSYLNAVDGLSPNAANHGSYLDVEPITGLSVNIRMRFQINLEVSRVRGILQFHDIAEGIFPVLWAGLEISLTEDWASFLKNSLNNPKIIAYSVLGILTFVSFVLIVFSLVVLRLSAREDDDPLIDVKEDHKENLSRKTIVTTYEESESRNQNSSKSSYAANQQEGFTNKGLDLTSENIQPSINDDIPVLPTEPSKSSRS